MNIKNPEPSILPIPGQVLVSRSVYRPGQTVTVLHPYGFGEGRWSCEFADGSICAFLPSELGAIEEPQQEQSAALTGETPRRNGTMETDKDTSGIIATQTAKVGQNKGKPRICLWNRHNLPAAGFDVGTPINVVRSGNVIHITIGSEDSGRKVSRVKNHGKILPVIDLKGAIADLRCERVTVVFSEGWIRISPRCVSEDGVDNGGTITNEELRAIHSRNECPCSSSTDEQSKEAEEAADLDMQHLDSVHDRCDSVAGAAGFSVDFGTNGGLYALVERLAWGSSRNPAPSDPEVLFALISMNYAKPTPGGA